MTGIAFLCLLGALTARSEFGLGTDYTTQAYKSGSYDTLNWEWQEEDTVDIETEGRAFWNLNLVFGGSPSRLEADNIMNLSTRSVREQLSLRFEHELAPALRLVADNSAELRYYHKLLPGLADTGYAQDYFNNLAELGFRYEPAPGTELGAGDRVEIQRHGRPDSFSYDYLVNRLELSGRRELGFLASLDAEYNWSRRWAGVSERDYDEHGLRLGFDRYSESGLHLGLGTDLVRRSYPGPEHSFREADASLSLGQSLGRFELGVEEEARWTFYDSTTEVYPDAFENTLELRAGFQPVPELNLRLGPRLDFSRSLDGPGEGDYHELSLSASIDFFRLDLLWLSFEDRAGRRRYPSADSAYQSDYWFNELNLTLGWTLVAAGGADLRLEGMASVTPEWHANRSDNSSFGMYSLELRYGRR